MMKRISITLLCAAAAVAGEPPPAALDLDAALARQSATELVDGVASAYDCDMQLHSFRRLGTGENPVYLVEVRMDGPECDDALLLLTRHGSNRDFIIRRWEPAPDIHEIDPRERGD